jgi:non-ribosomal peptide synthetase component F
LSLKTTLFVVLLAGYQILLSRWTGHNDVVNAISVADRGGSRYSTVFGYLITALPVASRIHGDRTIADFISQLAVQLDGGYPYKEFSYELYEDVFRPPKPFCPTLFNYIPVDRLTPEICGSDYEEDPDKLLFLSGPPFERQMHHREIYFELVELLVGLRGRIYFNTDYFARPSIERLVQHYIYILEQFADNSSARCKEVI